MNAYTLRRLLRFGAAGAAGGFIGFLLIEPISRNAERGGSASDLVGAIVQSFASSFWLFLLFGMIVSLGLAVAEEYDSGQWRRIMVRCLKALAVGAIGGGVAGLFGQFAYVILGLLALLGPAGQIVRRCVGWAILGAVIGAVQGITAGSLKKTRLGLVGGLLGGVFGGVTFDVIGMALGGGTASRLVAFTSLGMATGLAIALVEEIAKQAWIVIANGPKEGREYILSKPVTSIGRDEMADIPLFGDTGVARLHATINSTGSGFLFSDSGGGSAINGQPVQQKTLSDNDVIRVGRFNLRFRSKGGPRTYAPTTQAAPSVPVQTQPNACPFCGVPYDSQGQCACSVGGAVGTGAGPTSTQRMMPRLKVVSGPHAGASFDILEYSVTIGREPSNTISLPQDAAASRRHATLSYENGAYVVRDSGSANGTYVNGARITESPLRPGDTLQIGGSSLTLVFE